MHSSAAISGQYRYELRRWWDLTLPWAVWIMLNPSTADASLNDPTLRRCIGFTERNGCGGLIVVNLYAWRTPDPARLLGPAGSGGMTGIFNAAYVTNAIELGQESGGPVIAAWGAWLGNHTKKAPPYTPAHSLALRQGVQLQCFGTTKDGHPKHPLARGLHRIPDDQPLQPWPT